MEESQRLLAKAKAEALENEAEGKILPNKDAMGVYILIDSLCLTHTVVPGFQVAHESGQIDLLDQEEEDIIF